MRKKLRLTVFMTVITLLASLFIYPGGGSLAAISDGTYQVDYQILQAEKDSVSMANDYFEKPATLTVENGVQHVQMTINHSDWIKTFTDESGQATQIISENKDNDTRVVKFKVGDLSKPVPMKMHVLIETMTPVYDHEYTVRYDFDIDNMTAVGGQETTDNNKQEAKPAEVKSEQKTTTNENAKGESNPKTSDQSPLGFYAALLAIALGTLLFMFKAKLFRANKN